MTLHARIWKDPDPLLADYPWFYAIDLVTPDYPKGDPTGSSTDYGSVESFERALGCVDWAFDQAKRRGVLN